MITLTDSIEVEATPEEVFNWLVQRLQDEESYQAWRADHVRAQEGIIAWDMTMQMCGHAAELVQS